MSLNNLKTIRLAVLVAGVLVSWTTTIQAFANFYKVEGTLFKVKDCVVPNPVTTPCFWGALAFFLALVWAYKNYEKAGKNFEKYFLFFMVGSVIFAWSNFAVELKGIKPVPGALISPCPATGKNPFLSPCFFGSVLFSTSMIITYFIYRGGFVKPTSEK